MSFDNTGLARAIAVHGRVARVLVVDSAGSVPRGAGTAMLVWADGQGGTIGGGALEFEAVKAARRGLAQGKDTLQRQPLGPALAQCCGGAVTLLTEVWDAARLDGTTTIIARPLPREATTQPLSVTRAIASLRNGTTTATPIVTDGWIIEAISAPTKHVWIYGAGHVGRALVATLAPLPDYAITWIDTELSRYPEAPIEGVTILPAKTPADVVALAPPEAAHYIVTYSHALDLELCHRLLGHGFSSAGLIGSATKWLRFRKRLAQLGHSDAQINRITCPIGDPSLGKHPQAIAVSVVSSLLSEHLLKNTAKAARA